MREADALGCAGVPHICFDMVVDSRVAARGDTPSRTHPDTHPDAHPDAHPHTHPDTPSRIRTHTHPHTRAQHWVRRTGWFGREHLSFVRHQLQALGLVKREGVVPDVSHYWSG